MEPDATDKVLDAIARVDEKLDETNRGHEERFEALEGDVRRHDQKLDEHDKKLEEHGELLVAHAKLLTAHAELHTTLQQATARAVDHALKAEQKAGQSVHEATTIVESAIRMHSASIAVTVQDAVRHQVEPLVTQIETTKKATEDQAESVEAIKVAVTSIAKSFGHPKLRFLLVAAATIGALGGGGYAGYLAKQGADVVTTKTAPPPAIAPITTTVDASAPDAVAP